MFRDSEYSLPWRSFEEYYQQAAANQVLGYIGLAIPPERAALTAPLCEFNGAPRAVRIALDEELSHLLGQPLVGIFVRPQDPAECELAWDAITSHAADVFARGIPADAGANASG